VAMKKFRVAKLCVGLLCLLMATGLWGCGERTTEDSFEEEFTETITKIDLTAPESQKYRDWLEEFCTIPPTWGLEFLEPSSTSPKTNKPDIKESKSDWGREYVETSDARPVEESWKTWDWNDTWELELYSYDSNTRWDVLRARNKDTGETRFISEMFDLGLGFGGIFAVVHIDETCIIYSDSSGEEGWLYYFYALEQGESKYIGKRGDSGFLDGERTKWWYQECVDGSQALYYIDLRKMTTGDNDAEREIYREDGFYCRYACIAERDERSTIYFHINKVNLLNFIATYDLQDDRIVGFLELPLSDWHGMAQILPNRIYCFNQNLAIAYLQNSEKIDLSTIDFYVINLDI